MNLGTSFSYIFDDDAWVNKLLVALGVSLAAGFLSVILVGVVFQAALTGWMILLVRNMRHGDEFPLPTWDDFGAKVSLGLPPTLALIAYMIIPFGLSCVLVLPAAFAAESSEGISVLIIMCVLVPLLLAYSLLAWMFYSVGLIRYERTEKVGVFFEVGSLWRMVSRNWSLTGQYILFVIISQFVIGLLNSTMIGAFLGIAIAVPVGGHLLGQYALALDEKPKKRG